MGKAVRFAPAHVELSEVHRFRTPDGARDEEYAALSLRIRSGRGPAETFQQLLDGGHVRVHRTEKQAVAEVAAAAAARVQGRESQSVSVSTNALAAAVNEAVRDRLVAAGLVDDRQVASGSDGFRIGAGDRVMTRVNDHQMGVTNRQTWVVARVHGDGGLLLRDPKADDPRRRLTYVTPQYVRSSVQLAYAATTHAVQGETSRHGTLLLTAETDHAGVYVGLSRGRDSNVVHMVAKNAEAAVEQWVEAAGRNRADLGLGKATRVAEKELGLYDPEQPVERPWARVPDVEVARLAQQARAEAVTEARQVRALDASFEQDALRDGFPDTFQHVSVPNEVAGRMTFAEYRRHVAEWRAAEGKPGSPLREKIEAKARAAHMRAAAAAEERRQQLVAEQARRVEHPELAVDGDVGLDTPVVGASPAVTPQTHPGDLQPSVRQRGVRGPSM
jgi:hypothetical protein